MTVHYACPHLSTCSNIKYNKKACIKHCRLNIDRVKRHTLNEKIHADCGPHCPANHLNVERFTFQIYTNDHNEGLPERGQVGQNVCAKSIVHYQTVKPRRTKENQNNLSTNTHAQSDW
ncbi:hypothetical protein PSHT_04939 [Puccinia striiformis]|uniref:Uncharacterized protein n=2 Tax=Puccinia striiformis TaxID=27350 RepID=A0A2S4W160_9BASI|nr:hypothetical protein PSTT_02165 [Puccinia striiformis]POW19191.1 hypothetical protein PSHT_04939 [Puccinia striiformis]